MSSLPQVQAAFTIDLAKRLPTLHLDSLRTISKKYPGERQRVLSGYVLDALQGHRPHATVATAMTLSWRELRSDLHAKSADLVGALMSPLFLSDHSNHVGNHLTRAYVLRPDVRELATQALYAVLKAPSDREPLRPRPSLLTPPTPQHDVAEGMPAYIHAIPTVLSEITVAHVVTAHESIPTSDTKAQAWLAQVRGAIELHGGLPNAFGLQPSGRLNPKDARVQLVRMPQRVRESLLGQLGWFDVDMKSCHLAAFRSLGQNDALGFATERTTHYCANKDAMHVHWAKQIGHLAPACDECSARDVDSDHADDFKAFVLSFVNGGTLTSGPRRVIHKKLLSRLCPHVEPRLDRRARLATERAKAWVALPDVRALYTEIRHGRDAIIAGSSSDGGHTYTNAADRTLYDLKKKSIMSHELTGYEQFAMNVMLPMLPTGSLRSVIFDGWISMVPLLPVEIRHLTDAVRNRSQWELGFELDISLKVTPFIQRLSHTDF